MTKSPGLPIRDPLHDSTAPTTAWTTVNTQEGFPGVPTPLTWSIVGTTAFQESARQAFYAIGALRASGLARPATVDQEFIGIFNGRASCNLNTWRAIGDAMPGSSPAAIEAQIFGVEKNEENLPSNPDWRRYPVVATKFPVAARKSLRELRKLDGETAEWWRHCVHNRLADRSGMVSRLQDAAERITRIATPHLVVTMVGQFVYEQTRSLAESIGRPGLETTLMSGWDLDETRTLTDLWAVSRGQLSIESFLDVHGYHGPEEGELASYSWREAPKPLNDLIRKYSEMTDAADFSAKREQRTAERGAAEAEFLAALNPAKRAAARFILRLAKTYVPMRETGRNTFLKAIDVARFTARDLGQHLVAADVLDEVDDVLYFTLEELVELPEDPRAVVAFRRERRRTYQSQNVPDRWIGEVQPIAIAATTESSEITGMGVSPGVVEGRARVVLGSPNSDEMEDGEILVCRTTDPSWAAYFFVAAGVVIDIGGALSHGAIVAREVGLPCVINARNATSQIQTGDLIRVDGGSGSVLILERAQPV